MVRIMIVDDHTILRQGVKELLSLNDEFEVVGEAADGREALALVERCHPDVVFMDISMPGMGGIAATREIKKRSPEVKVIILTMYHNSQYVHESFQAGASGYLLKAASFNELALAVQSVVEGKTYLSPGISDQIVRTFLAAGDEAAKRSPWDTLSPREKEVVRLAVAGKTSQEIGDILCISSKTVRVHLSNIMKKLDIHSRTDLVRFVHAMEEMGRDV
ncbi:MAG: response regulator transcription factor [Thermodesulfobacteriota bacterium]